MEGLRSSLQESEKLEKPIIPEAEKSKHYKDVKLKYFSSLGMTKPLSTSPPNGNPPPKKERTKTTPAPVTHTQFDFDEDTPPSLPEKILSPTSFRKRAMSTPIPVATSPISVPAVSPYLMGKSGNNSHNWGNRVHDSDSEDENHHSEFIPPHELARMATFEVGTAHSVAVWEQRRRSRHNADQ